MGIRELRGRWDEELTGLVLKRLRSGESPDVFGHTAEGRWDLRGIVIREILRNATIIGVDLSRSSAERGGQFLGCTITDADLSHSTLKTNIDGVFTNCTFENSVLTGALFRGSFVGCSFLKTQLRDAAGESVTFKNCCFNDANLRNAHFCACRFESCTWIGTSFGDGSFYRSKFTGGNPKDVGNTIMDSTELA
jgi:uncharacterized protein YjbI with pentapeptide repeats